MRTIKFRGKAINITPSLGKGWVCGDLRTIDRYSDGKTCYSIPTGCRAGWMSVDVREETVGQFTGLYDKNGKEIYEGDIFGISNADEKIKNRFYRTVRWIKDSFWLVDIDKEGNDWGNKLYLEIITDSNYCGLAEFIRQQGFDYEVVGNIHDNPELLKTK